MPDATFTQLQRRLAIVLAVLALHAMALWALQVGLLQRAVDLVIPVQVMAELIEPPQPRAEPQPAPPPLAAPTPPKPQPRPVSPPRPQPASPAAPEPSAPAAAVPPGPPSAAAPAVPSAQTEQPTAPAAAAPTAPTRIELPSSSADYLNNPRPPYPPLSKRLGEQGKVVVRVLIDVDGTASRPEVRQSSGFDRLDQAAVQTVLRWRYVPGKRAGVPEAMWFNVPISFVLE